MSTAPQIVPAREPRSGEGRTDAFDPCRIRDDFPILKQTVHGKPLVYLDNAATAQKPRAVIEAIEGFYTEKNANIHRGVHHLSQVSTEAYEEARHRVRLFINAVCDRDIVFVRGTTEGINLVARSWGGQHVGPGDEIVVSEMEHHSNIVPWQILCEEKGARLRVIPVNDRGELLLEEYERLLNDRTRLVAVVHVSNVTGTVNPIAEMTRMAHLRGIPVLVDGAQALPHIKVDVQALDCDFYAFSAHKMYGPTGIGVLYGRTRTLESMRPYQGGGGMIESVTFEKTRFADIPDRFEAGTPNVAGSIGLAAAVRYLKGVGMRAAERYEADLLEYATGALSEIDGLRFIGTAERKVSVLSFVFDDIHPHDIGTILDQEGVAVRTGHHCAQPLMRRFGIPATTRAAIGIYNTREDIDALVRGLHKVIEVFR
jgi:cysteine desulfurase/selenocysteine lyase